MSQLFGHNGVASEGATNHEYLSPRIEGGHQKEKEQWCPETRTTTNFVGDDIPIQEDCARRGSTDHCGSSSKHAIHQQSKGEYITAVGRQRWIPRQQLRSTVLLTRHCESKNPTSVLGLESPGQDAKTQATHRTRILDIWKLTEDWPLWQCHSSLQTQSVFKPNDNGSPMVCQDNILWRQVRMHDAVGVEISQALQDRAQNEAHSIWSSSLHSRREKITKAPIP
mgnify:CR=1 FL=1